MKLFIIMNKNKLIKIIKLENEKLIKILNSFNRNANIKLKNIW